MVPLRVERTCRRWRAIILDTPAAWRLDCLHFIPADHLGTDHQGISLTIPRQISSKWVSTIMAHRNRIQQLANFRHHEALQQDFPMVTTIDFREIYTCETSNMWMSYASYIGPKLYPSLTTLNIHCKAVKYMPPLTTCASILVTSLFLECEIERLEWVSCRMCIHCCHSHSEGLLPLESQPPAHHQLSQPGRFDHSFQSPTLRPFHPSHDLTTTQELQTTCILFCRSIPCDRFGSQRMYSRPYPHLSRHHKNPHTFWH
jgi:hypothetical protein